MLSRRGRSCAGARALPRAIGEPRIRVFARPVNQPALFDDLPAALPAGGALRPEFLSPAEERDLIATVAALPLEAALYRGHVAKRRIASFGGQFDYDANRLLPSPTMPDALLPLRARVADWLRIDPTRFVHVLVAEYATGTQLGWHRDVPAFESIVGVCLLGEARMRFRPWPPANPSAADVFSVVLPPRAAYLLSGPARWEWQHSVAPTTERRFSVTFRTRRGDVLQARNGEVAGGDPGPRRSRG